MPERPERGRHARRHLRVEALEPRRLLATFVVADVGDAPDAAPGDGVAVAADGSRTLRAAIMEANASPNTDLDGDGSPDPDRIIFAVPPEQLRAIEADEDGDGVVDFVLDVASIRPRTELPDITDPVAIDGTTQPGFFGLPAVELDGSLAPASPDDFGGTGGLTIRAGGSTVRGLVVNRFRGVGISITGPGGNQVAGTFVGVDPTGRFSLVGQGSMIVRYSNDQSGINIDGSPDNTIGGPAPEDRNVLSGNGFHGVNVERPGSIGNVIRNNAIGVDRNGSIDPAIVNSGNLSNGANGIRIANAPGTIVRDNVIGLNNFAGILMSRSLFTPEPLLGDFNSLLVGNFIGTNQFGEQLANLSDGILLLNAGGNTIGGTGAGDRNAIDANQGVGISLRGPLASGNAVLGNFIGIASTTSGRGNVFDGILVQNASRNTIGGESAAAGNVIAGNQGNGVTITTDRAEELGGLAAQVAPGVAERNLVLGNRIGVEPSGQFAFGNAQGGILVRGSPDNTIGGAAPAAGNLVSGNLAAGITIQAPEQAELDDRQTTGNLILGNRIGTTADGADVLANRGDGVLISGASANTIGAPSAGNLMAGNFNNGLRISGREAARNLIVDNLIGLDAGGTTGLSNLQNGVSIEQGASGNTIGGIGGRNVISANGSNGILVGPGSTGNAMIGNWIGVDLPTGRSRLGNASNAIVVSAAASNSIGGAEPGAGNVLAGSPMGLLIEGRQAVGNVAIGNVIGTDAAGTATGLGNIAAGVAILNGATGNRIGGPNPGAGNLISGNGAGITLLGPETGRNTIQGNRIGTTADGSQPLPNSQFGLFVVNSPGNTIGGEATGAGNLVSGNLGSGIHLAGADALQNLIQGNRIGTDATGTLAVGNGLNGIFLDNAPSNIIGGLAPGAGNLVSGNRADGIQLNGQGSTNNILLNNLVGTVAGGAASLGNRIDGIVLRDAPGNHVGVAGLGNLVAGNSGSGVLIDGPRASGNTVSGNRIGTTADGLGALGNVIGILVNQSGSNLIGGDRPGDGNLVSGNQLTGVRIVGSGAVGNVLKGNLIGLDARGTTARSNGTGLSLEDASGTIVGGPGDGEGNTIAGNAGVGISVLGGVVGNRIEGNRIGMAVGPGAALPDGGAIQGAGILLSSARAVGIFGNEIAGNRTGILVTGPGSSPNVVQGNRIGTEGGGTGPGNAVGILVDNVSGQIIGGLGPGEGNTISGNSSVGVQLFGPGALGNVVAGNLIGALPGGGPGATAQTAGVLVLDAPGNAIVSNVVVGNGTGVNLSGTGASRNLVVGNLVGLAPDGVTAVANGFGVYLNGAPGNTIDGNTIAGNITAGVHIFGGFASGNVVTGNRIGTSADGTTAVPNLIGVYIHGAPGNLVGPSGTSGGNTVSGNAQTGIYLFEGAAGNTIRENVVGGPRGLGNRQYGILLYNAAGNTVTRSGRGANRIIGSGLAGFREFTGAVPTGRARGRAALR